MTEQPTVSRRQARALAAALAATVVTAVAAFGGLAHWRTAGAAPTAPAAAPTQLVAPAPQHWTEGAD